MRIVGTLRGTPPQATSAASVMSSRCGRAQIVAAGYESTQHAITTRLSSLEGYPSSQLYAILCTLLLEYRLDLRPEPRVLGARESGACARSSNHRCALGPCGVRCVFRHICAGPAIGAFAIDYEEASPDQGPDGSSVCLVGALGHGGA